MQYKTWLNCRVPRVINEEGKITTIEVPWSDYSSHYTFLFEEAVINLLQFCKNQTKTAKFFDVSFHVVNNIMKQAVARGLAKRKIEEVPVAIGIDEKSFRQGHDYVTVLTDIENGRVLEVEHGRTIEATKKVIDKTFTSEQLASIEVVVSDMWDAYLTVSKEKMPDAAKVIDRFHLIKYLNEAIDKTRKQELKTERELLSKAKYVMLKNEENLNEKQRQQFEAINKANLRTAHVWRAKENFKEMIFQPDQPHAIMILSKWLQQARTTTLHYLLKVADTFEKHFTAVANALWSKFSNAIAERINGAIQEIKSIGKGFRNPEGFRTAILFHYGKLSLYRSQNI
jgi:transposase